MKPLELGGYRGVVVVAWRVTLGCPIVAAGLRPCPAIKGDTHLVELRRGKSLHYLTEQGSGVTHCRCKRRACIAQLVETDLAVDQPPRGFNLEL